VDHETMLHHLEELADRLGIDVRYEAAAGRVGVCMLRGSPVAVIDANLRVPDRVAALASVLAAEETNGVYMPPQVRRRLEGSRPLRVRPDDARGDRDAGEPCGEAGAGATEAREGEETLDPGAHANGAGPEADAG